MLIVLEGADGCGKTTVGQRLSRYLHCRHNEFPSRRGTYTGKAIDSYLRGEWGVQDALLSAMAFQALMLANRLETFREITDSLAFKIPVVCSRYWQSGWVYGQIDGLDREFLRRIHDCLPKAHLNILLDVPAEVSMRRRAERDGAQSPERYEGKLDMAQRITTLYRELWDDPDIRFEEGAWIRVDATKPLDDVVRVVTWLADAALAQTVRSR